MAGRWRGEAHCWTLNGQGNCGKRRAAEAACTWAVRPEAKPYGMHASWTHLVALAKAARPQAAAGGEAGGVQPPPLVTLGGRVGAHADGGLEAIGGPREGGGML